MPALAVSSKMRYLAELLFLRLRLRADSRGLAAKQVEHGARQTDKNSNRMSGAALQLIAQRAGSWQCSKQHEVGRELYRACHLWMLLGQAG